MWLRKQCRCLGKEWIDSSQRTTTVVKFVNLACCNSHLVRIAITQLCIVVLYVAETLCLQVDILLESLHILLEIGLNLLELLRLKLECEQCLVGIGFCIDNGLIEINTSAVHTLLGLLERNESVVCCYILAKALLHNVDNVGTLGTVCTVEGLCILVPLVQVRELLILDVVVNLETLDTCLVHQVLNYRGDNLLVNLVHTERHICNISILRSPHSGQDIVTYARTLLETERLVVLHILRVVELLILYTLNLLVLEHWRVVVVRSFQDVEQDTVRLEYNLIHRSQLKLRNRLYRLRHCGHQTLQNILELLSFVRQRILQLVQLLELLDAVAVTLLVEYIDNCCILRYLLCSVLVQVVVLRALVGNQWKHHRSNIQILHTIGDCTHRTLHTAEVVVLLNLLNRS